MSAALDVALGDVRVGRLTRTNEGSRFELDDDYLRMAQRPVLGQTFEDDPSPRTTRQGVPPWFANLLPEGPLRTLLAERAGVNERRSFQLLELLGEDLPGAAVVRPSSDAVGDGGAPEPPDRRTEAADELRFSLAGVQLKFPAVEQDRALTIPVQGRGGDWIVKLPDLRYAGVPENEHLTMEWARRSGIDVPRTMLVEVAAIRNVPVEVEAAGGMAFAIARFDRSADGGRVHIEDFAQVLDLYPQSKYGAANYDTIVRVIHALAGDEGADEMLRRLVFAVACGNDDAHLKNWSLIYPDGVRPRLAPAYDLVATSVYGEFGSRLALNLAGVRAYDRVTVERLGRLAERAGLDVARSTDVVREQAQRVREAWRVVRLSDEMTALPRSWRTTLDERMRTLPLLSC